MLLLYAVHRADPVIILGEFEGLFIYSRNIYLIWLQRKTEAGQPSRKRQEGSRRRTECNRPRKFFHVFVAVMGCDLRRIGLCQLCDAGWSSPDLVRLIT